MPGPIIDQSHAPPTTQSQNWTELAKRRSLALMIFRENVFPFLQEKMALGERIAVVTLTHVEGSSPRPIGSQIGVSENGDFVGMLTGGCAEKAIVAEAVQSIEADENKSTRYGVGSPFVDVVLPCGSGIDIYIETAAANEIVKGAAQALNARRPINYLIDKERLQSTLVNESSAKNPRYDFAKLIEPEFRLLCFGEGANLISLCLAANAVGFSVEAYSPDAQARQFLKSRRISCASIHQSFDYSKLPLDPYCGIVTVFHEHEWEIGILSAALNSDAPYVGALGSRKTHEARLNSLRQGPPTRQPLSAIHGPVGLDIGAQSPTEIAAAIVAEVVAHRRKKI